VGRAHDAGGHSYTNDNYLLLNPCARVKASWQKPTRRLLEERGDVLCNQQKKGESTTGESLWNNNLECPDAYSSSALTAGEGRRGIRFRGIGSGSSADGSRASHIGEAHCHVSSID